MSSSFQQRITVNFIGSVIVAVSIAVALILDRTVGWGETRWSVFNPDVARIILPVLAVWIVVSMIERKYSSRSILLLVIHCVSVVVPTIALALMARRGHILSLWVIEYLEARTSLDIQDLETGIVTLVAMMAVGACLHAIRTWDYSRRRQHSFVGKG